LHAPAPPPSLEALGWDRGWAAELERLADENLIPARVAAHHRGAYVVWTERGQLTARAAGRLRHEAAVGGVVPVVGDWVAARSTADGDRGTIDAVLPRRAAFSRKRAAEEAAAQTLAANIDAAFVLLGLDADFSLRRLERYLTAAWESGAQPVVVLTKADLCADVAEAALAVERVAVGAPVHPLSNLTGEGLESLAPYLGTGRTAVLLGSSGVGKSTIVNALAGEELLATQEVREDDHRGRHTTSHRELILLPGGGVVLDTPGMRELQLWNADLEQAFGDVEEIARRCRFSDCAHDREPGCAIREALADGTLDRERWDSYSKLQRELEAIEARRNHLLRLERVREHKIRAREQRRHKKH
jgi:ribosome biogenesis GTPase / thiamine phosphate phosphatase